MQLHLSQLPSPLGLLLLVTDKAQQLRALGFVEHKEALHQSLARHCGPHFLQETQVPIALAQALQRYFFGDFAAIASLPVVLSGTPLQRMVWAALRDIPVGSTISYRQLAQAVGMTEVRAAQAIGGISAANPVSMVIPCHRVIGSNGDLKGYAWGLERKRWLLEHERALPQSVRQDRLFP